MLSIVLLMALPPAIALTPTAIERRLWWKKLNRIPWTDVSSIQRNPVGDYTIYGLQQPPIFYSRYYIDGSRLALEVARRTNLKIIETQESVRIVPR